MKKPALTLLALAVALLALWHGWPHAVGAYWTWRIERAARSNPDLALVPGASLGALELGMSRAAARRVLGPPERVRGGADEYLLRGFAVVVDAEDTVRAVFAGDGCASHGPLAHAFKGRTPEGLGMFSTRAELVAAYGAPVAIDGSWADGERLSYPERGIDFTLRRGEVRHLQIYEPRP